MRTVLILVLVLISSAEIRAQMISFNGIAGINTATDDALDGWSIADQYGGVNFSGYAGEMSLIFANQDDGPFGTGIPRGAFVGDSSGAYAGQLGLVVFCTDLKTDFRNSSDPTESFFYQAHSLLSAEKRYLKEGVSGYQAGGLRRAAYLIENYYDLAHAGSDLEAASLQAAIWEVLTDETPSLSAAEGNYFLRDDSAHALFSLRTQQMIELTDAWFADALIAEWGGSDYDPGDRVAFWLDPTNIHLNQSVISLNPDSMSLTLVPEPGSVLLLMLGGLATVFRRRVEC